MKSLMEGYKVGGVVALPQIGWTTEEFAEAAGIAARCGITMEEMARALTPKKKPESIRDILDAPMKKWREEA